MHILRRMRRECGLPSLVGEAVTEEEVIQECDPSAGAFATECYCVREGDTVSGGGCCCANQPARHASFDDARCTYDDAEFNGSSITGKCGRHGASERSDGTSK